MASHLSLPRVILSAACVAALLGWPARAATPSAALTFRFDLDPWHSTTRTVQFVAAGDQPGGDVTLVDSEGKQSVTAKKQSDAEKCQGAVGDERDTGLGDEPWCYELADVRAGKTVSGRLEGAESVVKLTVSARHGLLRPFIAALIAALAAAALVWTTNYGLASWVARRRLTAALGKHKSTLQGLEEWNADAEARLTEAQRLERIIWMHRRGAPQLKRVRGALKLEVERATPELGDNPLLVAARTEAEGTDVAVSDLVGPDDEIAVSEAQRLLELVRTARTGVAEFRSQVELLMPDIPDARKEEAEAVVRVAQASLTTLSPLRVSRVLDNLQQVIDELVSYMAPAELVAHAAVGLTAAPRAAAARAAAILASPRVRAFREAGEVGFAVGVGVVALMILVMLTALSANWAPNQTFAGFWDYAALVVSVFGSASIAGIVSAALLLGRTPGRAPGS